ncbi:MAG: ferritin-like domain-containing protein [Acidimicrobiales bacterium]
MDAAANLDRHLRGSNRLDLAGVAWPDIRSYPLSGAEVRCLTYMMDIESQTMLFLRDMLSTRVVEDPHVTSFLACWAYEELWHGEALSRFLGEAGVRLDPDRATLAWDAPYPGRVERVRGIRRSRRRSGALGRAGLWLASGLFREFPAALMTWGAVNELSTHTAYGRLVAGTSNPVLADVLGRLIRDERRHYAFYRLEAERRLAASATARRVTRVALDRFWAIVGTGIVPRAETDFVVLQLFGDADGQAAARQMDATVDSLPGQAGLRLFERALESASARRRSCTRIPSRGSGGTVAHT